MTVYYTIKGTAANGIDFSSTPTSVTFAVGISYVDIPIIITNDTLVEGDETVTISLQPQIVNGVNHVILNGTSNKPSTATLTIFDNDIAPNVWIERIQDGYEGVSDGIFRLRRDNVSNKLTVYYRIGGTATDGSDYTTIPTSVTLAQGVAYVDIRIRVIDDIIVENNETVVVAILPQKVNNVDQYILVETADRHSMATMTITDNDIKQNITVHSIVNAIEGVRNGYIRLEREITNTQCEIEIHIEGTAEMFIDYGKIPTNFVFEVGQKYLDIVVSARKDNKQQENVESVIIFINGLSSTEKTDESGKITLLIFDQDALSKVSVETFTDSLNKQYFRFSRKDNDLPLDVNFTISSDSTALADIDYEIITGLNIDSNIRQVHFDANQTIIDIPVNSLDFFADGSKFIKLQLLWDSNSDYYLVNESAVMNLMAPAVLPEITHDQYQCFTGETISIISISEGLLGNDYNKLTHESLTTQHVHVELVDVPKCGTLILNEDGTFEYTAGSTCGIDSFSYKVITLDGTESDIATVSLVVTLLTNNIPLELLNADEIPVFPIDLSGTISVGGQGFSLDPTQEFIPVVVGTYQIYNSATTTQIENTADNNSSNDYPGITPINILFEQFAQNNRSPVSTTYVTTVNIESVAYENGNWTYSEIVTWSYRSDSATAPWGGYSYTFMAWSLDGSKGFTYEITIEDSYDDTLPTYSGTTDSWESGTSHEWGTVTEYIYIGSWLTEGMAADIRSITTTSNLDTEGDYFYAVEGGNVSGTYREESYGYDYSYTNISLQLNDGTWNSTGFHLASSNGHSESGYGGCGYYYIDETSMEGDYLDVVDIDGYIEESGASNENYWYLTTGILTSAGWSMLGSGFSHSYNETYYLNGESGVLISGIYVSKFTSQCRTDDTIHYLDRYSVNRDTGWALVNGVWTATSGIETEKGYTEDNAKSETNGKYVEAGEEPGSKYYELSDSQSTDDYWLDRTIIAGMWKATAGESISGIDGKYQKDVMIESEKYERELTGGTMAGTLGTIRRDREEYQYESQSTIDNADWLLQSGTGFYRNDTSFGDFAEGEGKYIVGGTHKEQSWSYTGTIEESWKDLAGSGGRTDYEIIDHQWQIKDEWETETKSFEYKSCDQAEGTKAKNIAVDLSTTSSNFSIGFGTTHEDHVDHIFLTTPPTLINFSVASMNEVSDYNMERRYEITDETEVRTKWDDNGKLKTKGTRHIAEIDDFFESFESEKSHSVSASGTTHFGTISGTEIIDNYFERYSDDEWLFEHESDSLYKEEYKSTIEEYQEKNLNKTIDFDAEQYFFSGSEDSCSKIDNTTKSKITYEFESQNSDSDNEVTRTASITEETEKDHYSYYDFTNTIDFSDSYNEDKIRCISSEYSISEEKTTTGEGYKEFTALATKDFNDRWNAGSKLLQEQWTTEEIDASGTRTDEVNYVGTNPYPSDLNCQYSDLIEWNLTSFYNENYGYVRKADSRSNSYSAIENHVTGSMDADGQTSAILCFCHYHDIETTARGDTAITASTGKRHNDCDCGDVYNGTPEPKDNYDKTVTYAGFYYAEFYTGGYSYSRPSQSLPTLGNSNRMMTAEIDKNYATWAALNLPGSSITVGERNFSRFANYFAEYGFQGLEGDDYGKIVEKLANLSSSNSFYVETTENDDDTSSYAQFMTEQVLDFASSYTALWDIFSKRFGYSGVFMLNQALQAGWTIELANITVYEINLASKTISISHKNDVREQSSLLMKSLNDALRLQAEKDIKNAEQVTSSSVPADIETILQNIVENAMVGIAKEAVLLSKLRLMYVNADSALAEQARIMVKSGIPLSVAAEWRVNATNALKEEFRNRGPQYMQKIIEQMRPTNGGKPTMDSLEKKYKLKNWSKEKTHHHLINRVPNQLWTKTAMVMKISGTAIIVIDLSVVGGKVYYTEGYTEKVKLLATELGRMGGAMAGTFAGARIGGYYGSRGGLYGTIAGTILGGIAGGVTGGYISEAAFRSLINEIFPPSITIDLE